MRDLSSYTVVGLGVNASDDTVFLKKRVSYVAAIIQSAFGHLPESHKRFLGRETLPELRPLPQKGAQCCPQICSHERDLRRILNLIFFTFGIPRTRYLDNSIRKIYCPQITQVVIHEYQGYRTLPLSLHASSTFAQSSVSFQRFLLASEQSS